MSKFIKIIKKIKIKNLIILILLLVLNTYAWFVFSTKVSVGMTAHVSSWKVDFISEGQVVSEEILINVDKIFPGMMTFEKEIEVKNTGEIEGILEYKLVSLRIMDETFTVGTDITLEELENKIQSEYPFKIKFNIENFGTVPTGNKNAIFKVRVDWPFESGNDEKDTFWGNKAYDYNEANPSKSHIEIRINLIAKQKSTT